MKKEKKSGIIGGIIAIIIVGIVMVQFSSTDDEKSFEDFNEPKIVDIDNDGIPDENDPFIGAPRVWQTSGPFQIDKKQYALGELVLIRIGNIVPEDKGQMVFLMPSNGTHQKVYISIPFDGAQKNTFNQYFKPSISVSYETCSKDDLLGNWTVVFRDTNGEKLYENLKFEIVNRVIPGDEEDYEKIIC